jgi:hypothetical protein
LKVIEMLTVQPVEAPDPWPLDRIRVPPKKKFKNDQQFSSYHLRMKFQIFYRLLLGVFGLPLCRAARRHLAVGSTPNAYRKKTAPLSQVTISSYHFLSRFL